MTEESRSHKEEYDLQNTTGYKKYWTSKQTECNWTSNCLHWHHCDKETMEKMSSTLPQIQKVLISIGNTLADSIRHNDYEFEKLTTILNQQKIGEIGYKNKEKYHFNQFRDFLEEISHLGRKHNSYVTQTIADELLRELKDYNTTLSDLREKTLAQFKHLIVDIEDKTLNIELGQILIKIEQLDPKEEMISLKRQIENLQNDLASLRIEELGKLKKLIEQNQQIIKIIKSIDIQKLETTVYELNKKIPNIEPLLKEIEKMSKTVKSIGSAIGYEE